MRETLAALLEKAESLFLGKHKIRNIATLVLTVILIVLAVLVFVTAGHDGMLPFSRVLAVVLGVLVLLLAVEFVLFFFVFGEDVPNFFLYDGTMGKNMPLSRLTADTVSRRMDAYLGRVSKNKGQLWLPGFLAQCDLGPNGQFRELTAYKMLLDLAEVDSEGGWRCFCSSVPATVQWIADSLRTLEPMMMRDVMMIKTRFSTDPSKIRACLVKNAPYLKKRMLLYVTEHLDDFRGIR